MNRQRATRRGCSHWGRRQDVRGEAEGQDLSERAPRDLLMQSFTIICLDDGPHFLDDGVPVLNA